MAISVEQENSNDILRATLPTKDITPIPFTAAVVFARCPPCCFALQIFVCSTLEGLNQVSWSLSFIMANILTCHSKESTGVTNHNNDGLNFFLYSSKSCDWASKHKYQALEVGTPKCSAVIINVINYICALPAMTCQINCYKKALMLKRIYFVVFSAWTNDKQRAGSQVDIALF